MLTETLIIKTARLLHAGPAVCLAKREMISTAPMGKTTLCLGAPRSAIPFEFGNDCTSDRGSVHRDREGRGPDPGPRLRGAARPAQHGTSGPSGRWRRSSATGKIRPAAARREDPEKFRSRHGGLIGAASTTLVSHMDLLTRFSRIHDRSISSTDRMPRLHQMTENGSADLIAGRFPPVPSGKWAYPVESSAVYLPKLGLA